MTYRIRFVQQAKDDILTIYQYIFYHDSEAHADQVLSGIDEVCYSLATMPERGHIPPELKTIGDFVFREIHSGPYRIFYEVDGKTVFIHAILDGRRELLPLLEERLLH